MKRCYQSAFTLIELLVVTAILAVLLGLAGGAMARGKMAAQRVACMNNLKQWGQATRLYADDNEDLLPRESAVDGINSWEMTAAAPSRDVWYNALPEAIGIAGMTQYAQTPSSQQEFYRRPTLFHCPTARFTPISATYPNFSLAMNSKLMRDFEANSGEPTQTQPTMNFRGLRVGEVKVPERTALFLDGGVPGDERVCAFQAPYTGQPKAFASQFPARHGNAGNILFVAGHVTTLPAREVVDMNPDSVYRGAAIFPPTEVIWRHDPALVP